MLKKILFLRVEKVVILQKPNLTMLSIFKKQLFLADYLEGLIDIHNHLLPGIDDGAPSVEVSQQMISLYKKLGFGGVIATPHVMEDFYHNTRDTIKSAFIELKNSRPQGDVYPFHASAEYMLDGQFNKLLDNKQITPLYEDMILVEMSFFKLPMDMEEKLFNIRRHDFVAIMAHPERYSYLKGKEAYENIRKRGCFFQLNLLSLSGHYGKDAYKKAELLLKEEMIDFVATDAHKPEHLKKIQQIRIPKRVEKQLIKAIEGTKETFLLPT